MCQDVSRCKNTRLCLIYGMLITCSTSEEFVEFIKESGCVRDTKIGVLSMIQ